MNPLSTNDCSSRGFVAWCLFLCTCAIAVPGCQPPEYGVLADQYERCVEGETLYASDAIAWLWQVLEASANPQTQNLRSGDEVTLHAREAQLVPSRGCIDDLFVCVRLDDEDPNNTQRIRNYGDQALDCVFGEVEPEGGEPNEPGDPGDFDEPEEPGEFEPETPEGGDPQRAAEPAADADAA